MAIPVWAKNLLQLQSLDLEMRNLQLRLSMMPKEKMRIAGELGQAESELNAAKATKKQHDLTRMQSEKEIALLQDKIAKQQSQSALVKKNTEYQAMLATIEMLKNAISDQETIVLEMLDALEVDNAAILRLSDASKLEIANLKQEGRELLALEKEIRERVGELASQRRALAAPVEGGLLDEYERILKKGSGVPLVPIEEDKCGNCHLRLTPQTLSYVQSGQQCICDNCMHLLFSGGKS